jgi:hypothetical protein
MDMGFSFWAFRAEPMSVSNWIISAWRTARDSVPQGDTQRRHTCLELWHRVRARLVPD